MFGYAHGLRGKYRRYIGIELSVSVLGGLSWVNDAQVYGEFVAHAGFLLAYAVVGKEAQLFQKDVGIHEVGRMVLRMVLSRWNG